MKINLNFKNISKNNSDYKNCWNIFSKCFLNDNKNKNILLINGNEQITFWLFENSFRIGSGLGLLQYIVGENYLDSLIEKNKFEYLLLPKKLIYELSFTTFQEITSFEIYEIEYVFIKINSFKKFTDFQESIVLFTSGSSGERKPVIIHHKSMLTCSRFMVTEMKMTNNDVEIIYAQLDHAFALGRILSCAISESSFLFVNSKKILSPKSIDKFIQLDGLSGISCMPSVLYKILSNKEYEKIFSKKLKYVQIGAMFLPPKKKIEIVEKLPETKIYAHYGMTEYMRATFFEVSCNLNKAYSEGKPSLGTEIKILKTEDEFFHKDNFNKTESNAIGEILIKGPHLSKGYIDSKSWNKKITKDGFFKTGDIGYIDKDGFLIHKGRKDNIFNFQGKLFSTIFLQEEFEKRFPDVENNNAIFPFRSENSIRDTEIKVFLSNKNAAYEEFPTDKEIKKFFQDLGLRISIIHLQSELPRTLNGKIAYGKLKEFLNS